MMEFVDHEYSLTCELLRSTKVYVIFHENILDEKREYVTQYIFSVFCNILSIS